LIPVSRINLYIDEDAMDSDLVAALRSRGIKVMTAFDALLIGNQTPSSLPAPAPMGMLLYTLNVSDFYRLHTEWILAQQQQRFSIGEQRAAS
jgi:hypothetical protein